MSQTLEATIDPKGRITLHEKISLEKERRALVTVLDEEPKVDISETALLSEKALAERETAAAATPTEAPTVAEAPATTETVRETQNTSKTRETRDTSERRSSNSYGSGAQCAVMPSSLVTARTAMRLAYVR